MIADDIFNEMEALNLVDWGVVHCGCQNMPIGTLSPSCVSDYACEQLALIEPIDESFTLIAVLSLCTEINFDTREMLLKLCSQQAIDMALSKRKWLVFALKYLMTQLPDDSLEGILTINDFWREWGVADDSPNIIQGVGNYMTPNEFYSHENYRKMISSHNAWVEKELKKNADCVEVQT